MAKNGAGDAVDPWQATNLSGGALPARVPAYEDADGQVWPVYENPADMFTRFDITPEAEIVGLMTRMLGGLTGRAVAVE